MPSRPAMTDTLALRQRARVRPDQGTDTGRYGAERARVLTVLNAALATEIVCVLRCKRHVFMASGIHARSVAAESGEHAVEGQTHADLIATRIVQLGGEPDFAPDTLAASSHPEYGEGDSVASMLREDLVAERIAIDAYRELIRYLADDDATTRDVLETILASKEEHAEDLGTLLAGFAPSAFDSLRGTLA